MNIPAFWWDLLYLILGFFGIGFLGLWAIVAVETRRLLHSHRRESELRYVKKVISEAVYAAEQLADSKQAPSQGIEKRAFVVNEVHKTVTGRGFDPQFTDMLIEAAVKYHINWDREFEKDDRPLRGAIVD